jgi:hypothetical protein
MVLTLYRLILNTIIFCNPTKHLAQCPLHYIVSLLCCVILILPTLKHTVKHTIKHTVYAGT